MSDAPLTEAAPAKVNLFLHVTGRRGDGYHTLDSLAVFAGIADELHASPDRQLSLSLSGRFAGALAAESDNLILRAARALAAATNLDPGVRLHLDKHLPVASGIGGGSADAAAALRLLTRLWGVDPGEAVLATLAAGLGADVPVCLYSRPARMAGVGDVLRAAPGLPGFGLALVNPGAALATRGVFAARQGDFSPPATLPLVWNSAATMAAALAILRNDLEAPAIALLPVIAEVLAVLRAQPDCLLARMSGSGATCYALFPKPAQAAAAARALARFGWWSWGGAPFTSPLPLPITTLGWGVAKR